MEMPINLYFFLKKRATQEALFNRKMESMKRTAE
jgi:hypothetical protein